MSKRKELGKKISKLLEEETRLVEAFKDLDCLMLPNLWQQPLTKSIDRSTKARKDGNALYAKDNHDEKAHREILHFYTKSVAFAPPASGELALAYGNRSALLAHLGKYHQSIDDLDRALNLPLPDLQVAKYLCRKVECQAELGLQQAKETCELAKDVLQKMSATVELKKDVVIKLVKAIVKLEKQKFKLSAIKQKHELPNADKFERQKSSECSNASNALAISRNERYFYFGRHLTATRDIVPGEVLYVGQPYVVCPMQAYIYTNCSHCLQFTWNALPCDNCAYVVYCSETCKNEAHYLYHDIECKVIHRCWKINERMNSARIMSIRLLIMAMRESSSLHQLKQDFKEIDTCTDRIKKGFSANETFDNNYKSAYSLLTHVARKSVNDLITVSRDSAVLLYIIARYTKLFSKYFDYDKKALMVNDDALFIGKLLSHYQHLILINAVSVKDVYIATSTDWSWTAPKEENCTGVYLNPFLSLLNHSCYPNVTKCETEDHKSILYAIRPISKGEQVLDCYGPTYSEMLKKKRQEVLKRFYFVCECIACKNNWPMFMNIISSGVTFSTLAVPEIEATSKAQQKCEKILQSLKDGNANFNLDAIQEIAYAIVLTVKFCQIPNWRLPSLMVILTAVFTELYGYIIDMPITC